MPVTWPDELTPAAARVLQEQLRTYVIPGGLDDVRWVAGVDVAFPAQGAVSRAAAVLLRFPQMVPVAGSVAELPTRFPYVPGLLSFRELPALLAALAGLPERPDVILVDGQGVAHPRGFGVACHLGVTLDCPTIGVAKSVLCGHDDPGRSRCSQSPLVYKGGDRDGPAEPGSGCGRSSCPAAIAWACRRPLPWCRRVPAAIDCRSQPVSPIAWRAAPGAPVLGARVPVRFRSDAAISDPSVQSGDYAQRGQGCGWV